MEAQVVRSAVSHQRSLAAILIEKSEISNGFTFLYTKKPQVFLYIKKWYIALAGLYPFWYNTIEHRFCVMRGVMQ